MSVPPAAPDVPSSARPRQNALVGIALLLGLNLLGLLLRAWFVPLPGPVIGLGLLAAGLFSGVIKLEWVENGATALLSAMMLFFAPALVGVLNLLPILGSHWLPFSLAVVVSLVAVVVVTGRSVVVLERWFAKRGDEPSTGASSHES